MQHGGIIALLQLNEETDGALNADLMRILGVPLSQCHAFGWDNVADVVRHLEQGSAVRRYRNKKYEISNAMIYDGVLTVVDVLRAIGYNFATAYGAHGSPPQPIKRPWDKADRERIGSGAIPISEFESWYYG